MSAAVTLVVEGTYPTELGGVGVWVERLIAGLPEVKFRLARIGAPLPPRSRWPLRASANLVDAISIPPPALGGGPPEEAIDAWAARHADLLYHRGRVHAIGAGLAARLATEARRHHGARFLLTEHASYAQEIAQGAHTLECGLDLDAVTGPAWTRGEAVALFQRIAREAYQAADRVTALYPAFRSAQIKAGADPARTVVVPNGVPLPQWAGPRMPPHGLRPLRAGFVGRLDENKRPDLFARAATMAQAQGAPIRPVIIGPGPTPEALLARLEGVPVRPPMPPEIWPKTLDLLVLTSRHESQPLVLLEAMAAGVPVIAPRVGACQDLVLGSGGTDLSAAGLLVLPTERAEPFAGAIRRLATRPRTWLDASVTGRRRVRVRYSLDRMLEAFRALYAGTRPSPGAPRQRLASRRPKSRPVRNRRSPPESSGAGTRRARAPQNRGGDHAEI